ncbi:MAG: RNA polymerase subunit sigma [Lachnospiraceae bacterium]|nr:RNA polymerase subunit sigma [Lachnospiraceae bacterium]
MIIVNINDEAIEAAKDEKSLEKFIKKHELFILREAFRVTKRFVSKSDDEWSIALIAFHQAVKSYTPERGNFKSFAALIIKSRLTDYYRTGKKYSNEMNVAPDTFDGDPEDGDPEAEFKLSVARAGAVSHENPAKDEIEALNSVFAAYGFSFYDLSGCSPKKDKAKRDCAKAVAAVLRDESLLNELQTKKLLPIAKIMNITGLPRKIIENHRKYIIAAVEIMNGDYPLVQEYMKYIREEMSP